MAHEVQRGNPILIVPFYLFYLMVTTMTQAAADAAFSWWSPMVRPEYFINNFIPAEWMSSSGHIKPYICS